MQNRVQVSFDAEMFSYILPDEMKARMILQLRDVVGTAGDEIVNRDHFIAARDKVITQMRADKARAAGN